MWLKKRKIRSDSIRNCLRCLKFRTRQPSLVLSRIFYRSVGRTTKTLDEIREYINNHDSIDTIYDVFSNNCQDYVTSVVRFLSLEYPPELNSVKTAETPEEIKLGEAYNLFRVVRPRLLSGGYSFDLVQLMSDLHSFQRN